MLLTRSLPLASSVTFLSYSPGIALPPMGWSILHQSAMEKTPPNDMPIGQADDGNSPVEGPSSQVYQVDN